MKNEKKEKEITLDGFHAEQLNYIYLSLQGEDATMNAIEFNKQHNYEYKFVVRNLINTRDLRLLLVNGYELCPYGHDVLTNDCIVISHKN